MSNYFIFQGIYIDLHVISLRFSRSIIKDIKFAYAKVLETEDQCNDLDNTSNSSIGNANNPIIPDPNGPTELETYMDFLNDNYKDVYDKLQTSKNQKSIKRIVSLKENLEEDYNISFKEVPIRKNY